ncbi:hypothetical protein GF339_19135, partial [candidate division KSB3 bacterium]|nr:hypothetical protein [candidate division KSB3 bacterium]
MKRHNTLCKQVLWVMVIAGMPWLLTACPNPKQEQSLAQIQSQISVLSNEVREAFVQSEDERITLYKDLTEDIRALQKNQADAGVTIDQLTTTLAAIEAKLDEYNTRMSRLSERLDQTEMAMTERITSLSEQVNEIGRETTIIPGQPPGDRPSLSSDPASGVTPTDEPGSTLDPEASRFYHQAYTAYVN